MSEGRSSARSSFEWGESDAPCDREVRRLLCLLLGMTRKGFLRWDRIGVVEAAPTSHNAVDIPGVIRFRTWTSSSRSRSSLTVDLIWKDWSPNAVVRLVVSGTCSERSVHVVPCSEPSLKKLLDLLLGERRESSDPDILRSAVDILESSLEKSRREHAAAAEAAARKAELGDGLEW